MPKPLFKNIFFPTVLYNIFLFNKSYDKKLRAVKNGAEFLLLFAQIKSIKSVF